MHVKNLFSDDNILELENKILYLHAVISNIRQTKKDIHSLEEN